MKNTPNKISFAILCNGLEFEAWEAAAIEQLIAHPQIQLVLLIVNNKPPIGYISFADKLKNYPYKSFLFRFYKRFFLKSKWLNQVSLKALIGQIPSIYCNTYQVKKFDNFFTPEDVQKIQSYQPDFLLRFGFNIIKGDILNCVPYGIWSFHHADETKIKGGPAAFWEIYTKQNITSAILQRINNRLDNGIVLQKGYIKTVNHSYQHNLNQVLEMSTKWPLQVCIDILNGEADYINTEPIIHQVKLYKYPTNSQFLNFKLKLIKNKIGFHYHDLFRAEKWQLAIAKQPISDVINGRQIHFKVLQKNKRGSYFADPFLYQVNGQTKILFEHYDYHWQKGILAEINTDGTNYQLSSLQKQEHLSYPYIINHNQQVFCIPESFNSNHILLYILSENKQWKHHRTIVKSMPGVDPSLVFYENKWWLFFTNNNEQANASLYLYYADSIDGNYLPHANNPIKVDVSNARPAGKIFAHNNKLYRPAQNCAAHYGHKININLVEKISTTAFQERIIAVLQAPINSKFVGTHHLAYDDSFIATDYKTYQFSWQNFITKFKYKLGAKGTQTPIPIE